MTSYSLARMLPGRPSAGAFTKSCPTRSSGAAKLRLMAKRTGNGWWNFARGVSKGKRQARTPMTTYYHVFDTKLGFAAIAWGDNGITRFRLPYPDRASAVAQFKGKVTPQEP